MKYLSRIVVPAVALLVCLGSAISQTTVSVSPASQTVFTTAQFTVDVKIANVRSLHDAQFVLAFRNDLLGYVSTTSGTFLTGAWMPEPLLVVGSTYDTLTVPQAILGTSGKSGSGTLATITFNALVTPGTSPLQLLSVSLDSVLVVNKTATLMPLLAATVDGQVTITSTPLPITLSSFTGAFDVTKSNVVLNWQTVSEVQNYGFYVQRSASASGPYAAVQNGFVKGNGSTIYPHDYSFEDAAVSAGTWYYRLLQVDNDQSTHPSEPVKVIVATTEVENQGTTPMQYALSQNYPNPFNPTTRIAYVIPAGAGSGLQAAGSPVRLAIYDLLGREVAVLVDGMQAPGKHEVTFNAQGLPSGMYMYRLTSGSFSATRNLTLVK
jgi:hypothetical protein